MSCNASRDSEPRLLLFSQRRPRSMEVRSALHNQRRLVASVASADGRYAAFGERPHTSQASSVPRVDARRCESTRCDCTKPCEGGLLPSARLPILRPLSVDPAARKPLTPLWLSALRTHSSDAARRSLRAESVRSHSSNRRRHGGRHADHRAARNSLRKFASRELRSSCALKSLVAPRAILPGGDEFAANP